MNLTTIEIEQKIPSCKINKATIKKIIELIETEINKIPEEDKKYTKPRLDIRIKSGKKTITIHSSSELELEEIAQDLKSIRIEFRWWDNPEMDIEVDLGFEWWNTPTIEISGSESIWVNGILGQINEILTQNPTKNDLLHKNSTKIPIFLAVAILFGIGIYLIIPPEDPSDEEGLTYILGIPLIAMASAFSLFSFSFAFIPWFFPLVEFEERGIQRKIRKIMLIVITTIVLGIIVSVIYGYFSNIQLS